MSITVLEHGDIFTCGADVVVVPVNCVGVPGAGLALAAARRWPGWAHEYKAACRHNRLFPGGIQTTQWCSWPTAGQPRWIVGLATKSHWRDPSRLAWVEKGLCALRGWAWQRGGSIRLVAVPALGCGRGGLAWDDVRPVTEATLDGAGVDVVVFAPQDAAKRSAK